MERVKWTVRAVISTMMGLVFAAYAFIMATEIVEDYLFQSIANPPARAWFFHYSPFILLFSGLMMLVSAAVIASGWANLRQKTREQKKVKEVKDDDEDIFVRPPGFGDTKRVRTTRAGLGGLIGWNILGVFLLAVTFAVFFVSITELETAVARRPNAYSTAVLFGQITRYGALGLAAFTGTSFGLAWGRYFPLGELEVIEETVAAAKAPKRATWDRQ